MGNFRLACIVCAVLIQFTIAELEITVEPKVIWPGLTPKLVLNCSLTNSSAEIDFIHVLEITLSRYNETWNQFDDLLSQLINNTGVKQLVELGDAQISSGSQFLTLTLHNPTQKEANKYRCIAKGITRLKKYYSIDAYDKVNLSDITEYTEEIKRLRKRETELMTIKDTDKCSPTTVPEKEKPTLNFQGNSMIVTEYIQPLTLRCSFTIVTNDTKQNLSVNFMNIIHETDGLIASITAHFNYITYENQNFIKVEGEINDLEWLDSYLHITWTYPKMSQSGKYFCEAGVVDSTGENTTLSATLIIIVEKPTYEDLVRTVRDLLPLVYDVKENQKMNTEDAIQCKEGIQNLKINFNLDKTDTHTKIENGMVSLTEEVNKKIKSIQETVDKEKISFKEFKRAITNVTEENQRSFIKEVNSVQLYLNEEIKNAINNFSLTEASFKKEIDSDLMNMKEDIKKAITNLSLTHVSYQKGVNSDLKQMEEQINRTLNSFKKTFDSGLISVKDEVRKTLMSLSLQKPVDAAPNSCRHVKSSKARVVVTLASGLKVMCDTETDGGGWIIIQRRINGELDFFKDWNEYRDGFGDYNKGEFYLGNENIFLLTSRKQQELRFDLEYKNLKYFAQYSDFKLLSENDQYQLKIERYSGNAGDSMKRHHNLLFTTFDKDNDNYKQRNCADVRHGAWWYDDCADVNLNGRWGRGEPDGAFWDTVTVWESVSFSEMKIRENE